MANQLKMATIDSIQTLHQRGWSMRRIARALGIHRDTVARHLRQAKQAGAPAGAHEVPAGQTSPDAAGGKVGQAPTGSDCSSAVAAVAPMGVAGATPTQRQASLCQPYEALILAQWEQGLTA